MTSTVTLSQDSNSSGVDVTNLTVYSNTLQVTAPWILSAPVIAFYVGSDSALKMLLQTTSNILTSVDTVEFIVVRSDGLMFWIIKRTQETANTL